jgi:DNA-directed RNA polymerase subunit RPC12/RpoP
MPKKFQGLEEVVVQNPTGKRHRGFEVNTYLCKDCGTKDDYKDDETKCHKCGHNIKKKGRIKAKPIRERQVEEMVNRNLMYKCPVCKKMYEFPIVCCNQKFQKTEKQKKNDKFYGRKIAGYYCTGCNTMYTRKVECCTGSKMIEGDIYPDMSYEDYLKMPKLYIPLDQPDPRWTERIKTL